MNCARCSRRWRGDGAAPSPARVTATGVADFISVLDAERTLLSLQEQRVTSETQAATRLVAVYKALGGGGAAGE
jgi:hypothetical protein